VRFGGREGARVTVQAHHSEAGGPIDRLGQTDDTTVATKLIAGIFNISGCFAYVLIDTRCSHSVSSKVWVKRCGLATIESGKTMLIRTFEFFIQELRCSYLKIQIAGRELRVDPIVAKAGRYDAGLGMVDYASCHD
jgi:hypothetical protein